jgi:hypothetical protein
VARDRSIVKFNPGRLTLVLVLGALLSAAASAQGSIDRQPTDSGDALVAEIYLARDDGSGKAGDASSEFRVTDVPIYCVVNLTTNEPMTVKMNLVAVDVQGVKPETKVVTTSYTTKDRQNRVNFTGRPEGKWVAGKYRADIYVKEKLVWSKNFSIGGASVSPKPAVKPIVARGRRA